MKKTQQRVTALLLLACLIAQACFPAAARAYDNMTCGDRAIDLIKRYESFSPDMYYEGGHWYVGYGSQVAENAYPDGISEEEALELVRGELAKIEESLNSFFSRNGLTPTQAQFDALADFTYTLGDAWLSGNSALLRIVRGDTEATRLETAQAFGVWSHSGGVVLPGLARRRLEEAAIYLDGADATGDEFAFLAVSKADGVICSTDFAAYERGGVYDAFPTMFLLGKTLAGVRTKDGAVIRVGDAVTGSYVTTPIWEDNVYSGRYDDVQSGAWYYDYVMELSENGVVSGRGDGCFDPAAPVTVGEALKLILLAAGKEPQEPVGNHWASGYAAYARSKSYLSDALLSELDEPIRRADVAELAAKAIGFGQSYADSPFADTDNGFAIALSEIGVLNGIPEHGKSYFYPDKSLTRAEVSAIVWRLRNQVALHTVQYIRCGSLYYEVRAGVPLNSYDRNAFSGLGKEKDYAASGVTVLRGIDVSRWQDEIDWEAAAADGIDFAMLRVGGRGQNTGEIYDDLLFEDYYEGAEPTGLLLGYYFYSQAINTREAVEEADYVISMLRGRRVDAPVVFDWETAENDYARTNSLSASAVSDCAIAFCERIRAAGYAPMVYMNTEDGYFRFDVSRLTDYPIWYAGQYNGEYPRFVYDFDMWQYTSDGELEGVEGGVDMDLWFLR